MPSKQKIILLGFTVAFAAVLGFGLISPVAHAYTFCPVGTVTGNITNNGTPGGGASATATNTSNDCYARVTFTSYKIFITPYQAGWLNTQVLNDTETLTLAPRQTANFSVSNPGCKYQLDIYEGEAAYHLTDADGGGSNIRLLDWYISGDNLCTNNPPPTPQLACSPAEQGAEQNVPVNFHAIGGTGTYSWHAANGTPSSGAGQNFTSQFINEGWNDVVVTSGSQTATCQVNILPPPDPMPLECSPANQTGNVGATLNFSALGGSGTYSWSAPSGSPASGTGSNFNTSFGTSGTKFVTVASGSQTTTCSATISQQSCVAPAVWLTSSSNVSGDSATLNGQVDPQGNSTTYYFEYGPSTAFGSTTNQQTITSAQSVSATINGLQANTTYYFRLVAQSTCGANKSSIFSFWISSITPWTPPVITPVYNPPIWTPPYYPPYNPPYGSYLYCNPQYQNANVGDWVPFNASGSSGTYSWFAPSDAYPNLGGGAAFGTRFSTPGFKTVTVSATGGGSAQCNVNIAQTAYAPPVTPPAGRVLGAADIVTGPENSWPIILGLGFLASALAYYFYFGKKLATKKSGFHIRVVDAAQVAEKPKRKTELESLLEKIKAGEKASDA